MSSSGLCYESATTQIPLTRVLRVKTGWGHESVPYSSPKTPIGNPLASPPTREFRVFPRTTQLMSAFRLPRLRIRTEGRSLRPPKQFALEPPLPIEVSHHTPIVVHAFLRIPSPTHSTQPKMSLPVLALQHGSCLFHGYRVTRRRRQNKSPISSTPAPPIHGAQCRA